MSTLALLLLLSPAQAGNGSTLADHEGHLVSCHAGAQIYMCAEINGGEVCEDSEVLGHADTIGEKAARALALSECEREIREKQREHFWAIDTLRECRVKWCQSTDDSVAKDNAFDSVQVKKTVLRHHRYIHECYDKRVAEKPSLAGDITIAWSIEWGLAGNVRVTKNNTGDPQLAECLVEAARGWEYPAHLNGEVSWPFHFLPPEPESATATP